MASLKIYGGRLHSKRMQDLPLEPDGRVCDTSPLEVDGEVLTDPDRKRAALRRYCGNDLGTTKLLADGLKALQSATIASALPFTIALLCSMWGLLKALRLDATKQGLRYQALSISPSAAPTAGGWQRRLRTLMLFPRRAHVVRFIAEVVRPAYEAIAEEMRKQGYEVEISEGEDRRLRFEITHEGEPDFIYEVRPRAYAMPSFVVTSEDDEREERKYFRAEVHLKEGGQDYDVMGWSREDVIGDILGQYEKHMHFLHMVR